MTNYLKCQNCKEEVEDPTYCEELKLWLCEECLEGWKIEASEKINKTYE